MDEHYTATLKEITTAIHDARFKSATEVCTEHFATYCTNTYWNVRCHEAFSGLGEQVRAERHRKLYIGLGHSVWSSGDGSSLDSAFIVIDLTEQSLILTMLGVTKRSQATVERDGHYYDRITTQDSETKEERFVYFNVDAMFAGYDRLSEEEPGIVMDDDSKTIELSN